MRALRRWSDDEIFANNWTLDSAENHGDSASVK
jgi:hypothetical protein